MNGKSPQNKEKDESGSKESLFLNPKTILIITNKLLVNFHKTCRLKLEKLKSTC